MKPMRALKWGGLGVAIALLSAAPLLIALVVSPDIHQHPGERPMMVVQFFTGIWPWFLLVVALVAYVVMKIARPRRAGSAKPPPLGN